MPDPVSRTPPPVTTMPTLAASEASAVRRSRPGRSRRTWRRLTVHMVRTARVMDHRRGGLRLAEEIRNTGVVKKATVIDAPAHDAGADHRTRDRVCQLLLEHGAATAGQLGKELGLSPAGIRRHLDALVASGEVVSREQRTSAHRGRGRPARIFLLTDEARVRRGRHTYDDLAAAALRWIAVQGGAAAAGAVAEERGDPPATRSRAGVAAAGDGPLAPPARRPH